MMITPVIKKIIIINVIALLFTYFKQAFMYEHFALFYFGSSFFKPYQILTHIFMHGGVVHLLFNMYSLWIFGTALENIWGGKKFLLYFLVTGIGAALLHSFAMWVEASIYQNAIAMGNTAAYMKYWQLINTPTVGASGAVYGVLLGYGMLFPNRPLMLIFPPIELKAKYFVIIFGVLELILGLVNAHGSIAHFAHLGGMIFGWILLKIWQKQNTMYN